MSTLISSLCKKNLLGKHALRSPSLITLSSAVHKNINDLQKYRFSSYDTKSTNIVLYCVLQYSSIDSVWKTLLYMILQHKKEYHIKWHYTILLNIILYSVVGINE